MADAHQPAPARQHAKAAEVGVFPRSPMTELPRFLQIVLRQMRLAERVVLGLWASVAAGCVAIFASALPSIYAQEYRIRCGSLGLTRMAIGLVPQCIGVVVMLTAFFSVGRGLIAACKWRWASGLPVAGAILLGRRGARWGWWVRVVRERGRDPDREPPAATVESHRRSCEGVDIAARGTVRPVLVSRRGSPI